MLLVNDSPEERSEQPSEDPSLQDNSPPSLDIESLRLGQNFEVLAGVKKALTTVPVRKPNRQSFVRVRPGEEWRLQAQIIELKEDREIYVVQRPMWGEVAQEVTPVSLFTAINRQGVLFIWPVKLPGERQMAWHKSAMEAAQRAMNTWVSVRANMDLAAYDIYEATGELGEPEWPEATFEEILAIAFKDRLIDSLDHPVLKRLRGAL